VADWRLGLEMAGVEAQCRGAPIGFWRRGRVLQ